MGLGRLLNRDVQYVATNTKTGAVATFNVIDGIAPDWSQGEYRGAMRIPGVWRAAILASDLLGSLPWDAYQKIGDGPVKVISSPLLEQPNPPETRMNTFSSLMLDLLFHGNAIGVYASWNAAGYPTSMLAVPADCVGIRRVPENDFSGLPLGSIVYYIGGRIFTPEEVLHIKGPSKPGCPRGMGILEAHMEGTLGLSAELARQAAQVGKSGVPTGTLKSTDPDMDQIGADELKAAWLTAQQTRTVAVLNATTDFTPLSWNPTETQLLEARKFSLQEIALLFGLDPQWLGVAQSSRVYTNVEQEGLNLIKYTLGGHLARFEQALSQAYPRGTVVKANLDSLLRADTMTRYQAHQIGIDSGFLTVNEAREFEDLAPLPDGGVADDAVVEDIANDDAAGNSNAEPTYVQKYPGSNVVPMGGRIQ